MKRAPRHSRGGMGRGVKTVAEADQPGIRGRPRIPPSRRASPEEPISPRSAGDSHELQRMLLEAEGVEFSLDGRVELKECRWKG